MRFRTAARALCGLALAAAGARTTAAQGLPVGPEFPLNVTTAGDQASPAIAVESDGGYVVAWRNGTSAIVARRLHPRGPRAARRSR